MTFKEQMQQDVAMFINADEFAEPHNLNGTICDVVLEGLTTQEQFTKAAVNFTADFDGINGKTLILHCTTSDLPEVPKKGIIFELDGETYRVKDSVDDMGLATITLECDEM